MYLMYKRTHFRCRVKRVADFQPINPRGEFFNKLIADGILDEQARG